MSGATGGTSSPFHFNSVEMREAEQAFRHAYPAFESTSSLDALRAREYARLDDLGQIYLDYTGVGSMPRASCASILNCCAAMSLAILTRSIPPREQ